MINESLRKAAVSIESAVAVLLANLGSRSHARRGASMLEYAMIALVVIGFLIVFRNSIGSAITNLLQRIGMDINSATP